MYEVTVYRKGGVIVTTRHEQRVDALDRLDQATRWRERAEVRWVETEGVQNKEEKS